MRQRIPDGGKAGIGMIDTANVSTCAAAKRTMAAPIVVAGTVPDWRNHHPSASCTDRRTTMAWRG
jgi:hypothetical protein